jgi:hypothetical protein
LFAFILSQVLPSATSTGNFFVIFSNFGFGKGKGIPLKLGSFGEHFQQVTSTMQSPLWASHFPFASSPSNCIVLFIHSSHFFKRSGSVIPAQAPDVLLLLSPGSIVLLLLPPGSIVLLLLSPGSIVLLLLPPGSIVLLLLPPGSSLELLELSSEHL